MNIEIANHLVELRRGHNLSQEDLAARLGVSRQAVSKWERAESAPDTDNLISLARLYGVSLDALLLNGTDEPCQTQAAPEESRSMNSPVSDAASLYEEQLNWEAGDKERRRQVWLRRRHFLLCFPYPVLVVIAYLALGFLFHWWHPGWMLFLSIPIYYCVLSGLK